MCIKSEDQIVLDFTQILQNLLLIDCQKSSYFLHLKHFLPSVCLGATKPSRAVVRDKAPWRREKGDAELWEMPSPKHFPGAGTEETHPDPTAVFVRRQKEGVMLNISPCSRGSWGHLELPLSATAQFSY